MKLERVSAIVHSPALAPAPRQWPPAGESLLLTVGNSQGAETLATTSGGVELRLTGIEQLRQALRAGDKLLVRVIANDPVLELEVETATPRASTRDSSHRESATTNSQSAMRMDQAALRQIAWQAPNAAALAVSWRDIAHERWSAQAAGFAPEGSNQGTTMLGAPPFREPPSALPPPLNAGSLCVYAWGGMHMMLGLVRAEEEAQSQRRERRATYALRLQISPAALGRIALHAHALGSGIQVSIAIERSESVHLVRAALPTISSALARAGLKLVRLRLTQGSASIVTYSEAPRSVRERFASHASAAALFRALAETTVVLLQIVPDPHSESGR